MLPRRENLIEEATALVRRAELKISSRAEAITVGFRKNGSFSVFFGEDPVYQFNAAGELRRAFVADTLYKAEGGILVALTRQRSAESTALVGKILQPNEQGEMLRSMQTSLAQLRSAISASDYELVTTIPPAADVVGETLAWLCNHSQIAVAQRPNVG